MVKLNEEKLVLIELPKLVVKQADAEHYLHFVNKFASDIRNNLVTDLAVDEEIVNYETVYADGEFIPVVKYEKSFDNALTKYIPQVSQLDKFVVTESNYYECKDEIVKVWKDSQEQPVTLVEEEQEEVTV